MGFQEEEEQQVMKKTTPRYFENEEDETQFDDHKKRTLKMIDKSDKTRLAGVGAKAMAKRTSPKRFSKR